MFDGPMPVPVDQSDSSANDDSALHDPLSKLMKRNTSEADEENGTVVQSTEPPPWRMTVDKIPKTEADWRRFFEERHHCRDRLHEIFSDDATQLEKAAQFVFNDVLDYAISFVAFEIYKLYKSGAMRILQKYTVSGASIDDSFRLANTNSSDEADASQSTAGLASSSISVPPLKRQIECVCPNCRRNLAASRFAPHLEKCMGMGRNSSRLASRRILAASSSNSSASAASAQASDYADFGTASRSGQNFSASKPVKRRKKKTKDVVQPQTAAAMDDKTEVSGAQGILYFSTYPSTTGSATPQMAATSYDFQLESTSTSSVISSSESSCNGTSNARLHFKRDSETGQLVSASSASSSSSGSPATMALTKTDSATDSLSSTQLPGFNR